MQGFVEVPCDADVIDDVSALFAAAGPVDAGDGLKQIMSHHLVIKIHDLLDRRIESGDEHVVHDQNRERIGFLRAISRQPPLESLDVLLLLVLVGPVPPRFGIIVVTGDYDGHVECLQPFEQTMSAHQELLLTIQFVNLALGQCQRDRRQRFQFGDQFVPRRQQFLAVQHGCPPTCGDDLGLETLGHHDADIMLQHVPRLRLDQQGRFQNIPFGPILGFDDGQLVGPVLPEHVLKELIQAFRVLDQTRPPCVLRKESAPLRHPVRNPGAGICRCSCQKSRGSASCHARGSACR